MSIKSKVIAAAAALTLIGGVGAAATVTASAATPSCGPACISLFSRDFGTYASPNFVTDVFRQGAKVGQPIILWKTANSDPAEDFTLALQGSVADFYAAGLVSSAVALHYGCSGMIAIPGGQIPCGPTAVNDPAFELEYAPFGVDSGLCAGVSFTAFQGENVSLQPCGASSKTVWIADVGGTALAGPPDDINALAAGYIPWINGSDTNFSHPFVLTYPKNGYPTDKPRPQVQVTNLTGFSNGFGGPILGTVSSNQTWGLLFGVLP